MPSPQSARGEYAAPSLSPIQSWPVAYPTMEERRGTAHSQPQRGRPREDRIADALGWFSIGLGILELIAPRTLGRAVGVPCNAGLVRVMGLREIATGIGILTQPRRSEWLWARVAGDGMDAATLAVAAVSPGAQRGRALAAGIAVAGVTALDVLAAREYTRRETDLEPGGLAAPVRVQHAVAVNRPAAECYRYWRDVQNLPLFMKHLKSVRAIDARRSHWVAAGPLGTGMEWDSEIIGEVPDQSIAWRTLPGADIPHSGSVHFAPAPGGRGTVVRVEMVYDVPGGQAGAAFARFFGMEPGQLVKEDTRRFKQILETGEVPTTVGQPSGRRSALSRVLLRKGKPG